MDQEGSNSTEYSEHGSFGIEFLDDQLPVEAPEEDSEEDPEEDPEEFFDDDEEDPDEFLEEPLSISAVSGPKSEPEYVDKPQFKEEEVDQPLTLNLAKKMAKIDAARVTNIKDIYPALGRYASRVSNRETAEFYAVVMLQYRAAVRARGRFKLTKFWDDAVERTTRMNMTTSKLRKLRKIIILYCCSDY